MEIRAEAEQIIQTIIEENLPQNAVTTALMAHDFGDRNITLVAIGKAAFTMAKAASDYLGDKLSCGIVITKYDHSTGTLPNIDIYEAGHPILDENTLLASAKVVELVENLNEQDEVLFLVSGGGSALFEAPKDGITLHDLQTLGQELLTKGVDIVEINALRKRLSKVKAGGFAKLAAPAKVFAIVLSDVIGDRLDTIASGPAAPDHTTVADVTNIIDKYKLDLPDKLKTYLQEETPKQLDNVETLVTGSVRSLATSAAKAAEKRGYTPYVLTTTSTSEASEAGEFLGSIAADTLAGITTFERPCAIIAGGETVVTLKGRGIGGRNQELALAAAPAIAGHPNVVIFSVGSDGTDGPTDAAGGLVDGETISKLVDKHINIDHILANNDSHTALKAIDGLVITGPTGTNVNDVAVVLIK